MFLYLFLYCVLLLFIKLMLWCVVEVVHFQQVFLRSVLMLVSLLEKMWSLLCIRKVCQKFLRPLCHKVNLP